MARLDSDDPARGSAGGRGDWRDRYRAARSEGVPLDPRSEPVEGVDAYPTDYAPDHLLISTTHDVEPILDKLRPAAADFGWGIELRNLDNTEVEMAVALDRAVRGRRDFDLPTIYRVQIFPQPSPDKDDQPVPPIDAWRLLQRARARNGGKNIDGVMLDHVLTVDPFGGKTNPFGGKTNPYGGKTNPFSSKTNGLDSYEWPGSGGRQVVSYLGPEPVRQGTIAKRGRRPVVAVLDTGCGHHPWLPDDIVTRYPRTGSGRVIGKSDPATDPELTGDLAGPFDGALDGSAGHGTFIAGVVRQLSPESDIVSIRIADSMGNVLEGEFLLGVRTLVKWMLTEKKHGGRAIDVINLSIGYYHETPDDGLFDTTLAELLLRARRTGCAVVCSAGNDATDRPTFPAALWQWGNELVVPDPKNAAPHVSVGALNPNGTVALFSNIGSWVKTYAPGAAVLSCFPHLNGGLQPEVRNDRQHLARETIDPDDFDGGFALWSGTSFAAPYVAGMLAARIAGPLMAGKAESEKDRVASLRRAWTAVDKELRHMRRGR
ncbi:S8 family peptidase [Microbacterium hominis]|uniref:S8/S53 family peptidase n=1 Tax=Microbacterium hominis TaxID=162426 RepID=A0A7D4PKM7_9MICO|nr:S8/S53 family peptidase [Microbacterium hominis]QKJ18410.1 S8/S53 family peptidase [Microbacterium hominis]